ncbi:hypothetical protein ANN_22335 [Periplaneta americana]|uniref:Uncharacterized protein n=1 Tax=Periplaneta americana TaxID=6978 RepID=A0ABQ8S8T4_PERAM|nr:hypothetical protein ANN_22335 [Periplaneta americana]
MVTRNYDIGGGEHLETASNNGGRDIVDMMRRDYHRSSRRSGSQTSGTVRHGRFQYLGDRPFEVTDSLKGYNRVTQGFLQELWFPCGISTYLEHHLISTHHGYTVDQSPMEHPGKRLRR